MPLYDYECGDCGHRFELRRSFDSEPEGECPRCQGLSRRQFHAVPIIFKGSGFYTTDYKSGTKYSDTSKNGTESEDSKEKKEKVGPAKATADKSESKTESKVEAPKEA